MRVPVFQKSSGGFQKSSGGFLQNITGSGGLGSGGFKNLNATLVSTVLKIVPINIKLVNAQ